MKDGLNRYAYCLNNPVKYIDPTGKYTEAEYSEGQRIYNEQLKNEINTSETTGGTSYKDENGNLHIMVWNVTQDGISINTVTCPVTRDGTPSDLNPGAVYNTRDEAITAAALYAARINLGDNPRDIKGELYSTDTGKWGVKMMNDGRAFFSGDCYNHKLKIEYITIVRVTDWYNKIGISLKGALIFGLGIEAGIIFDSKGKVGLYLTGSAGVGLQLGSSSSANALVALIQAIIGGGLGGGKGTMENARGNGRTADGGVGIGGTWDLNNPDPSGIPQSIAGIFFGGGVWYSTTGILPLN